jgi:alpha-tubulin suppressor-like RCC1 family protein
MHSCIDRRVTVSLVANHARTSPTQCLPWLLGLLVACGTLAPASALATSTAHKVAGGYDHTCVLTAGGGVKCWGDNVNGQLGDGTTTDRRAATDVVGLTSGVAFVATGDFYTCALTTAGGVKCWGQNASGQLGDGTTTDRSTPVDVVGLTSGVVAVATGWGHTCAVTTGGGVKCWGDNF